MILDEIQPGLDAQENSLVFKIMMLYRRCCYGNGRRNACCFTASSAMMDLLSDNPKWVITFGGHPVIAAACLAT
jgi:hypothetical protein